MHPGPETGPFNWLVGFNRGQLDGHATTLSSSRIFTTAAAAARVTAAAAAVLDVESCAVPGGMHVQ